VAQYVPGVIEEMSPRTLSMLQKFREVLGLQPLTGNILADPLEDAAEQAAPEPTAGAKRPAAKAKAQVVAAGR